MNWCQAHWDQLRAAIQARGLEQFGAKDPAALIADIKAQAEGVETQFDPLMSCFWHINSRAASLVGMRVQGQCPFCLAVADGHPEIPDKWITEEADGALGYARAHGLITVN